MEPKFVDHPAFTVVGMTVRFEPATAQQTIPPLWDRFVPRMKEVRHVPDGRSFGVCWGNEYLAGVPVTKVEAVPAGMEARTVPAGHHAVFTHRGPVSRIQETLHHVFQVWLPASGRALDEAAPVFELYDERFQDQAETSELDIYVPLRR